MKRDECLRKGDGGVPKVPVDLRRQGGVHDCDRCPNEYLTNRTCLGYVSLNTDLDTKYTEMVRAKRAPQMRV